MIDFKKALLESKTCSICNKVNNTVLNKIDNKPICSGCFTMLLSSGRIIEDDEWHFENIEDLKLL